MDFEAFLILVAIGFSIAALIFTSLKWLVLKVRHSIEIKSKKSENEISTSEETGVSRDVNTVQIRRRGSGRHYTGVASYGYSSARHSSISGRSRISSGYSGSAGLTSGGRDNNSSPKLATKSNRLQLGTSKPPKKD